MQSKALELYSRLRAIWQISKEENGQDLVEYALVIAVVCLGIISGMNTLADGINTAMGTLSTRLSGAVA